MNLIPTCSVRPFLCDNSMERSSAFRDLSFLDFFVRHLVARNLKIVISGNLVHFHLNNVYLFIVLNLLICLL